MSNRGTKLYHLLESGFDIGLDLYPIFDESHRETLNNKLINEYYFRFTQGTADEFKFYLNRAMEQIMPYHNELYESKLLEFDPLITHKLETLRTMSKQKETESNSVLDNTTNINNNSSLETNDTRNTQNDITQNTSTDNNTVSNGVVNDSVENLRVESDTPQDGILIGDLENNLYASMGAKEENSLEKLTSENGHIDENVDTTKNETVDSTGKINSDTNSTTNSLSNVENDTTVNEDETINDSLTESGYDFNPSELIESVRKIALDVDMLVVKHPLVAECFDQIYF